MDILLHFQEQHKMDVISLFEAICKKYDYKETHTTDAESIALIPPVYNMPKIYLHLHFDDTDDDFLMYCEYGSYNIIYDEFFRASFEEDSNDEDL